MSKKSFWLLLLILIIATFLRTYQIKTIPPGLYPDEAMNGNNALEALRGGGFSAGGGPASGWKVFYPENNGREGLFINIQAIFLKVFHVNEPWVLRLPSAIFGILTVLGIYLLGSTLFSEQVGLLAAFFLATNFWHINFSRIGFRAIMAPLLLTWATYLLITSLKHAFAPKAKKTHLYLSLLGGIIYGLGFYTYIAYRVSPILIFFIIGYYWPKNKSWRVKKEVFHTMAHYLLATFLVALPIGLYFLHHPADFFGRTSEIAVSSSSSPLTNLFSNTIKTLGMFNFVGDWNWRHNYAGRPELFFPVGILFLVGLYLAWKYLIKKSRLFFFPFSVIMLWFLLALLPVVLSNEGIPHALRSILLIPPTVILAATGGVWAYEHLKHYFHASLKSIAFVFLALLLLESWHTYFVLWAGNQNVQGAFSADYVATGRALNQIPNAVPKYVVIPANGVLVRGIPMPAQTVMFITGTFLPKDQAVRNIHYVLREDSSRIPPGSAVFYLK